MIFNFKKHCLTTDSVFRIALIFSTAKLWDQGEKKKKKPDKKIMLVFVLSVN